MLLGPGCYFLKLNDKNKSERRKTSNLDFLLAQNDLIYVQ